MFLLFILCEPFFLPESIKCVGAEKYTKEYTVLAANDEESTYTQDYMNTEEEGSSYQNKINKDNITIDDIGGSAKGQTNGNHRCGTKNRKKD